MQETIIMIIVIVTIIIVGVIYSFVENEKEKERKKDEEIELKKKLEKERLDTKLQSIENLKSYIKDTITLNQDIFNSADSNEKETYLQSILLEYHEISNHENFIFENNLCCIHYIPYTAWASAVTFDGNINLYHRVLSYCLSEIDQRALEELNLQIKFSTINKYIDCGSLLNIDQVFYVVDPPIATSNPKIINTTVEIPSGIVPIIGSNGNTGFAFTPNLTSTTASTTIEENQLIYNTSGTVLLGLNNGDVIELRSSYAEKTAFAITNEIKASQKLIAEIRKIDQIKKSI